MRVRLARPQIRIDNKITFYRNESLNINGFDAGAIFKERLRVTLGYYYLNDDLSTYEKNRNGTYINKKLKLRYGSLNLDFICLNTRFFTIGVPVEFGFGKNQLRYRDFNYEIREHKGFISLLDFGISVTFKPIRWVGVRGVAGYRKTLYNQIDDFRFDGYFLSGGIAVNIHEITKDLRMYQLKRKYKRVGNPLDTAVDLITD